MNCVKTSIIFISRIDEFSFNCTSYIIQRNIYTFILGLILSQQHSFSHSTIAVFNQLFGMRVENSPAKWKNMSAHVISHCK